MKRVLIWIILIIILVGLFVYFTKYKKVSINNMATENIINNMETEWTATGSNGYSFKYPEKIGTNYINTADWPPVLNMEDKTYNCTEGGTSQNDIAGKTNKEIINGKEFCITRKSEGAAGSVYTNYTYTFAYENKTMIATFSLRAPQCMNYDNPQQTECINEEKSFDISHIIVKILATIQSTN